MVHQEFLSNTIVVESLRMMPLIVPNWNDQQHNSHCEKQTNYVDMHLYFGLLLHITAVI